jgi:hypothetical protein
MLLDYARRAALGAIGQLLEVASRPETIFNITGHDSATATV